MGSHITFPFQHRPERQLTAGVPRETSLQSDLALLPLSKDSPFPLQGKEEISLTVPTAAFLRSSQQQKDILNPIAEVTAPLLCLNKCFCIYNDSVPVCVFLNALILLKRHMAEKPGHRTDPAFPGLPGQKAISDPSHFPGVWAGPKTDRLT